VSTFKALQNIPISVDKSGLMTLLMILLARQGMAEKDSDEDKSDAKTQGRFILFGHDC
jgi:hypothetical protein